MDKAVVLWTGGKDSYMAYLRALEQGVEIVGLATFVPHHESEFKAHPQSEMMVQARQLDLPIQFLKVSEPYRESYIENLMLLRDEHKLSSVITGDIDLVSGQPNWILDCCTGINLTVIRPLWKESRNSLLAELLARKIQARITWINHPKISQEWIGRTIDSDLIRELKNLASKFGIDICGENGEYHTMVEIPSS